MKELKVTTKRNLRHLSKFEGKICRSISCWSRRKVIHEILNDREDESSFEEEYVSRELQNLMGKYKQWYYGTLGHIVIDWLFTE